MYERIKEIITSYVDVSVDDITENSQFIADLGFNSFDFMSFLGEIEDEYDIEVDEREALKIHTVGEAAEYIASLRK